MANTVELTFLARDQASQVIRGVMGSIQGMLGQLTMVAGIGGAGLGLGTLIKRGVEFNQTMEDTKGGLAGVLLMTREYTGANGELLTGQRAVTAAMAEAGVVQEKLKKDALGTAASYTELVGAFQSAVGPATAAGVESLDSVREITVKATQAMSALGIPTVQAAQELRGLFAGDMGPDNRLNQILRVTKEDLAKVHGNAEATAKLFLDRLSPAASAAAMQTGTLTVRLSNLGDIVDQVMGKATAGIFRDVSSGVADLIAWVEKIGPKAEEAGTAMWTAFKAALGPIEEVGRSVFAFIDSRAKASGGTWTEVFQGLAITFNNVMGHIRSGWVVVINAILHPLDTLRLVFGNLLGNILSMLADVASKVPAFLGGKEMEGWLRGAADAVDEWGLKNSKFLAGVEVGLSRTEAAWEANEKAIVGAGGATAALASATSRAKGTADEVAQAAYHFGTVWAAESVKATAAFQKFLGGFASFTGDKVGEAIAKIEAEYEDLVGQLGQMMFMAKVPFERGLEMLRQLAQAKGQQITAAIFNGEAAVEDFISLFEAKLTRDDALMGIKTAWSDVMQLIPGAAASAYNAVRDVWSSMTRTFDDAFFSVISGRLDSLGDVFRGFASDMQSVFSRLVSGMVERWLSGQQTIAEGWAELNKSMQTSSGNLSVEGGLMAAGMGYGVGSFVGQGKQANQIGGAIGGVVGGIIGSIIPVIGTALGALIGSVLGALIGELFNKNTEKHLVGSLGGMVGATSWTKRPIYDPTKPGGAFGYDGGDYDPGEPIGWETVGTLQKPTTAFERQGQIVFERQTASFADLFRLGAKDQARDLVAAYQAALRESLSGANFDIAAGSLEDIENNAQFLLSTLLPRIGLSAAFGQKGYLPTGYRDGAGGIPGINYGMPGMDESGQWIEKQLFDPEAPIPKMLAGLGFTEEKISELAGRISTDDPEKLLAYITGIVGVVVGLRDLGAEMGKTFDELAASWKDEAAEGPAAAFGKAAKDLAGQFDALSLYSGDEQLKKAQEATAAAREVKNAVFQYVSDLVAAAQKLSAGLQGLRVKMREFLNPLSESDAIAADWSNVEGIWGRLFGAMTPAEIESATNDAAAAIERMFEVLAERVTRGKALLDRIGDLLGKLSSLGYDVYSEQKERTNPLEKWGTDLVAIQRQVQDAARLSGLEEISAIEGAATAAETLYGNLKGLLAEISTTSASIAKSISSQIWELGVGEMDAQGQAGAITQRIKELQDQLAVATSPAEIAAITSEIQSLTSRYVGTFDKDDPNRSEAIRWAQEQLERARGLAQDALETMREQAEKQAKELEGILKGAADLIKTNVDNASKAIGQLSHTLGELDKAVQEALKRLGQDALDSLGPLREAMDGAAEIFTGATTAAGTALTAPESGFTAATERSTARLNTFSDALDRAVGKLNGFAPAGTTAPPPAAVVQQTSSSRTTSAEIVATVRRHARQLTPRVA